MRTMKPGVSRKQLPLVIAAFAGTLGVWGCSGPNDKAPVGASSASPSAAQTATTPTPDVPPADTAVPRTAAADAAKGSDPAMTPMSKREEASAMPMPGQANDHSTLADKPTQK
jgi:hypothetical protein